MDVTDALAAKDALVAASAAGRAMPRAENSGAWFRSTDLWVMSPTR